VKIWGKACSRCASKSWSRNWSRLGIGEEGKESRVGGNNFAVGIINVVESLDVGEEESLEERREAWVLVWIGTCAGEGKVIWVKLWTRIEFELFTKQTMRRIKNNTCRGRI
jgi:hypothetical protein